MSSRICRKLEELVGTANSLKHCYTIVEVTFVAVESMFKRENIAPLLMRSVGESFYCKISINLTV